MSKKVLFIDRDGTLVLEPPTDYQLDSFEKLQFYPKTLSYLSRIATEMNYELVMVSNQDGLGTDSFLESDFFPVHNLIIETLENEGIHFAKQHIDRTFEKDNATTRKPHTGMLQEYFSDTYDLENSFVIGDRFSDIELAHNLGAKGIFMEGSPSLDSTLEQWQKSTPKVAKSLATIANDWEKVYYFLKKNQRTVSVERNTKETQIQIHLALDGSGESEIHTGIGFFDHMLEQISKHALVDLKIQVQGDLEIDEHHTMEDTALALGEAFKKAVGDKLGMERYGFCLPMDDCLAQVALDFGGRPWCVWEAEFNREKIGDMPTEMFFHFFKSFSDAAACNLNIKAEGQNEHHKIEAIFKSFAKAIKMAKKVDYINQILPSSKGVL